MHFYVALTVITDPLMELLRTGTNLLFQIMSQCYEQWETHFFSCRLKYFFDTIGTEDAF